MPFAPGLTATARGLYTSNAYVSSDNTQQVPAWATLDVGARYRAMLAKTPVVIRASVTNVMDSNYWIASPTGHVISGMLRMAWISLQADFWKLPSGGTAVSSHAPTASSAACSGVVSGAGEVT